MVIDDINLIMQNAINSNYKNNLKDETELINNFYKSIKDNYDLFNESNQIDLSNSNGYKLDINIIDKIFNKYLNIFPLINDKKDLNITKNNLLYSTVYSKLGIIHVIFDGNSYVLLEMILLGIITHNTIIFSSNDYMCGTNGLIISLIQTILTKENYIKEMFQYTYTINHESFFENFKTINKTIIIGNNELQTKYLKLCPTECITSGFNYFDIYLEDLNHVELIKKIIRQRLNINLYINSKLNIEIDDAIFVEDIDEAITYINYNSSKYSCVIFTQDINKASKFIREINSKNVLVNASPSLEYVLDIEEKDLLKEKNIIMSNIYKFDGTKTIININE